MQMTVLLELLLLWLKLLWNPDHDVAATLDAYCARMFGPAAEPMRSLIRLEQERWELFSVVDELWRCEHLEVLDLSHAAPHLLGGDRDLERGDRDLGRGDCDPERGDCELRGELVLAELCRVLSFSP